MLGFYCCRYFIEKAATRRAKCISCERYIVRNTIRIGVLVPTTQNSLKWRHLACVSDRQKNSMAQKGVSTVMQMDGFLNLSHEDQDALKKWFNDRTNDDCSDATIKIAAKKGGILGAHPLPRSGSRSIAALKLRERKT